MYHDEDDENVELLDTEPTDEMVEEPEVDEPMVADEEEGTYHARPRFGEREYNQARNEKGQYDRNYYKNRAKELDKKVSDAQTEKKTKSKEVPATEGKGKKTPQGAPTKTVQKNRRDQLKDDVNLLKAKKERFDNKIASAKARTYQATHPVEAAKEAAKDKVKEVAKEKVKQVVKKQVADKAKKEVAKKAVVKFFASNPWVWAIAGAILIVFFIIVLMAGDEDSDSYYSYGLAGYNHYEIENLCKTVRVYDPKNQSYTADIDFETEYIPGVLIPEVGGLSDNLEVMKEMAILARNYALHKLSSECIIESSSYTQNFSYDANVFNDPNNNIMKAVKETYGLVFVQNGRLKQTAYDAACYRGEDDEYYYIGYGSETIGPGLTQAVPKDWADRYEGLMVYINKSINSGTECAGNHGYGATQWGSYYLAKEEGYNYEQLLHYYLGEGELYTIYGNNYNLTTSNGTNDIINTDLESFLTSKGTSVEQLNEYILSEVLKAGVGTRNAVVAAVTALVGGLYENYQARIPYTMCGQHYCADFYNEVGTNVNKVSQSFYGADPNWGSVIHNRDDGLYHYGSNTYTRYGPDCSGFVGWALHNAGFDSQVGGTTGYGPEHPLNGTRVAQPGDLLNSPGHIMIIIGVDDTQKVYYIAHAAGGSQGVKINTISYGANGFTAYDMSGYYENHKMKVSDEEFTELFRAGYVNGYSSESTGTFINNSIDKAVYFVGDSRFVGTCNAAGLCSDNDTCDTGSCLAKTGAGYSWFTSQISKINSSSKGNIVFNMGVNDLVGNADGEKIANTYFREIETIAANAPERRIYIMSVNPVTDGATVKTDTILKFNSTMIDLINSSSYNIRYIDTYNNIDFDMDGSLHYKNKTYKDIYDYVMGVIS